MDQAFYDSDEDVAWGPYTLREAKRDLRRPPSKITRRHSDTGPLSTPPYLRAGVDRLSISEPSVYFKAEEESVSSNRNEEFLEKMVSVINEEDKGRLPKFSNQNSNNDIIVISDVSNSSLDNDSLLLSDEKDRERLPKFSNRNSNNDTIVISDVSNSSLDNDPGIQIKIEAPTQLDITCTQTKDDEEDILAIQSTDVTSLSENEQAIYSPDDSKQSSELSPSTSLSRESSMHQPGSANIASSDYNDEGLNDTLEEMEMMLKFGPNYVMPDVTSQSRVEGNTKFGLSNKEASIKVTSTPPKAQHKDLDISNFYPNPALPIENQIISGSGINKSSFKTPATAREIKKIAHPNKRYDHIKSPVREYIHDGSPLPPKSSSHRPVFKLPRRMPELKNHQTSSKFKDIVSPIGVYIKNTPTYLISKTVGSQGSALDVINEPVSKKVPSENTGPLNFPQVIYKPPKSTVSTTVGKATNLPSSLKKYVQEATVTTHQKRTNHHPKRSTLISQNLLDGDLTSSSLDSTNSDISVVTVKPAFKK